MKMPNKIVRDIELDELKQCNIPLKTVSALYIEFNSPKGFHYVASYTPNLSLGPVVDVKGSSLQNEDFMYVKEEVGKKFRGTSKDDFIKGDRDISNRIFLSEKKSCRDIADIAERLSESFSDVKITFISLKDLKSEYNIPASRIDPKFL